MTDPIEIAGAVLGVICVVLFVRQNVWAWPTGIVNVGLYIVVFYRAKLYADMGLQVVYVVVSLYGWYQWLHPGEGRRELPVTRVSLREGVILGLVTLATGAFMAHTLATHTDAALPYWDSATVAVSLAAQWLMTRKKLENWMLWIGADLVMIGIYLVKALHPTAALYAVYTVLAILGLRTWRKSMASSGEVAQPAET